MPGGHGQSLGMRHATAVSSVSDDLQSVPEQGATAEARPRSCAASRMLQESRKQLCEHPPHARAALVGRLSPGLDKES
jgi:hypothetical protein